MSAALTFSLTLRESRSQSTWRLRRRERRLRRRANRRSRAAAADTGPTELVPGERDELAQWAAIRRVLFERGVDLSDA